MRLFFKEGKCLLLLLVIPILDSALIFNVSFFILPARSGLVSCSLWGRRRGRDDHGLDIGPVPLTSSCVTTQVLNFAGLPTCTLCANGNELIESFIHPIPSCLAQHRLAHSRDHNMPVQNPVQMLRKGASGDTGTLLGSLLGMSSHQGVSMKCRALMSPHLSLWMAGGGPKLDWYPGTSHFLSVRNKTKSQQKLSFLGRSLKSHPLHSVLTEDFVDVNFYPL